MHPWPPLDIVPPIPCGKHPGAFGAVRKYDRHTGVDLYAPVGAPVFAMNDGTVLDVQDFTGPAINMPWWNPTKVIYIDHGHCIIAYGEVESHVKPGDIVGRKEFIGHVLQVLKEYKGRPMSMLHLEMYSLEASVAIRNSSYKEQNGKKIFWDFWNRNSTNPPKYLQNPTEMLLSLGTEALWHDPYLESESYVSFKKKESDDRLDECQN